MNILVDLGNSRLKWAQQDAGLWRTDAALLGSEVNLVPLLDSMWQEMTAPRKLIVCSVSNPPHLHAVEQWAQRHWSIKPHIVHAQAEQLGVKNCYRDPRQLGADRWAALIGARGLGSSATCIVDCGTAVTVDALSADGEFLGGVIFPGLRLLRESLVRGTQGISATEADSADSLARSTADGVAAGTFLGLVGAVERLMEEYRPTLGATMQVLLTGGDAPLLVPRLRVAATLVPDLVLKGLARIAETV